MSVTEQKHDSVCQPKIIKKEIINNWENTSSSSKRRNNIFFCLFISNLNYPQTPERRMQKKVTEQIFITFALIVRVVSLSFWHSEALMLYNLFLKLPLYHLASAFLPLVLSMTGLWWVMFVGGLIDERFLHYSPRSGLIHVCYATHYSRHENIIVDTHAEHQEDKTNYLKKEKNIYTKFHHASYSFLMV